MSRKTFLLHVIIAFTIQCLSAAPYKSFHFDKVFDSEDTVGVILKSMNLSFAPGLLPVLLSAATPTTNFFKRLPFELHFKHWAVYLLVLEKVGRRPKIYVGSGTESRRGIASRFYQYKNHQKYRSMMPLHVLEALNEGFVISSMGLLCWVPVPPPSRRPVFRVAFLALETVFAFMFWAMRSTTKDYGYGEICPWNRNDLQYDGACNHSALLETANVDFTLGPAELEARADAAKRQQNHRVKAYVKRQKALDEKAWSSYRAEVRQRQKARDPVAYKRKQDEQNASRPKNLPKKHPCLPCGLKFRSPSELANHRKSAKHREKVGITAPVVLTGQRAIVKKSRLKALASKRHHCKTCDYTARDNSTLQGHYLTAKHRAKVAASGDVDDVKHA